MDERSALSSFVIDGLTLFKLRQTLVLLKQLPLLPSMGDHPAAPSFSGNIGSVRKANSVLAYGNMPEPWGSGSFL